uniref:Uncharacterized protein n=1 Tax=Brassica campestris TaxID=3711 RepID=A0A3P6AWV1_BRACM|nr:unnamed protein product [Brassica rapa]
MERSVVAHDGDAEDRREYKNLQKLTAGEDVLTGTIPVMLITAEL